MQNMASSYIAKHSRKTRIFIICVLMIGIFILLYLTKSKAIRIIAKNPAAFRLAMKGKEVLDSFGLTMNQKGDPDKVVASNVIPDDVEITVDLAQSKGKYNQFWGGIGYNSFKAGSLNRANQKAFELMVAANKKNPGTFNYIRAFNIFTNGDAVNQHGEGCEIYSEDLQGLPRFNWTVCDQVFDYMVSLGFDMLVNFTLMPVELASNKKRIQPWFGGNMSPPLSHEKWANLVYETTRHLVDRYGLEKVSRWYFEVWNEPDLAWLFWIPDNDHPNPRLRDWGDMDAYNKLFDYTVAAVKRVHPELRVGGPAVAGSYIEPLLYHLDEKNYVNNQKVIPMDFLSFHSYGSVIYHLDEIYQTLREIKKEYQQIPVIISEYNSIPYDRPWFITRYPAMWLMATIDAMFCYADQNHQPGLLPVMMIYWTSPTIKNFGKLDQRTDGIITTLGPGDKNILKLPIFNAFEMLGYLSNERVAVESNVQVPVYNRNNQLEYRNLLHAIATRSDSTFEVLLYQFTEGDHFCQLGTTYQVRLKIVNIPDQKLKLKKFEISEQVADAFTVWKRFNSPSEPDMAQWESLNRCDDLNLSTPVYEPEIRSGNFFEEITLLTNQAILFVFSKKTDYTIPLPPVKILKKEAGANRIYLEWQPPQSIRDADHALAYAIYENQQPITRTFNNFFEFHDLTDDINYNYQIYSLDDQGNMSKEPLSISVKTIRDNTPPELVALEINSLTTLDLKFNKPIEKSYALNIQNYEVNYGIKIESISINQSANQVQLKTTPHQQGEKYTLTIHTLRDQAHQPNVVYDYKIDYEFLLEYHDVFDSDNLNAYIWTNIWPEGGSGDHNYDAINKRLKVITGDNIGERFAHSLPESDQGTFQIDFHPIRNYPDGGRLILRLKQSDDTYYQLEKNHGFGPGHIKKVVQGLTVDSTACLQEFRQGFTYNVLIHFNAAQVILSGFSETIKLARNHDPINVREFEIDLLQQDAGFDNIFFRSDQKVEK